MSLIKEILEIILPSNCINCYRFNEGLICNNCKKLINFITPESFITRKKNSNWEIEKKYKNKIHIEKVFYFIEYNELIHKIFMQIKFNSKKAYIKPLLEIIFDSPNFKKIDFSKIDYITYVPITQKREFIRKFNQSQEIAKILSKQIKKPVINLLQKIKETQDQAKLSKELRNTNLINSFSINKKVQNLNLDNKIILLVDDICTTGTTIIECSKTIIQHFRKTKIQGFCISRGSYQINKFN